MGKYKVQATGMEFLEEVEIEADSEYEAINIYQEKWNNGLIVSNNYELVVKTKENSNG